MSREALASLLVVEDEENVGATLRERLTRESYQVEWVKTVEGAREAIRARKFDLALLDVGLPDGDGYEVATSIKKAQEQCAVIFLTAFAAPEDRVRGLELGAEDYIGKPFHFNELLLRIQNGLRRSQFEKVPEGEVAIGQAQVNFASFEITAAGKTQALTQKECALLKLLFDRRGRVVSRGEIIDAIWADHEYPTTRTVDNFIVKLRRLLEVNPDKPDLIRSVRGVGYQMTKD